MKFGIVDISGNEEPTVWKETPFEVAVYFWGRSVDRYVVLNVSDKDGQYVTGFVNGATLPSDVNKIQEYFTRLEASFE